MLDIFLDLMVLGSFYFRKSSYIYVVDFTQFFDQLGIDARVVNTDPKLATEKGFILYAK